MKRTTNNVDSELTYQVKNVGSICGAIQPRKNEDSSCISFYWQQILVGSGDSENGNIFWLSRYVTEPIMAIAEEFIYLHFHTRTLTHDWQPYHHS